MTTLRLDVNACFIGVIILVILWILVFKEKFDSMMDEGFTNAHNFYYGSDEQQHQYYNTTPHLNDIKENKEELDSKMLTSIMDNMSPTYIKSYPDIKQHCSGTLYNTNMQKEEQSSDLIRTLNGEEDFTLLPSHAGMADDQGRLFDQIGTSQPGDWEYIIKNRTLEGTDIPMSHKNYVTESDRRGIIRLDHYKTLRSENEIQPETPYWGLPRANYYHRLPRLGSLQTYSEYRHELPVRPVVGVCNNLADVERERALARMKSDAI